MVKSHVFRARLQYYLHGVLFTPLGFPSVIYSTLFQLLFKLLIMTVFYVCFCLFHHVSPLPCSLSQGEKRMWNLMGKKCWLWGKAEENENLEESEKGSGCEGEVVSRSCSSGKTDLGWDEGRRNSQIGHWRQQPTKTLAYQQDGPWLLELDIIKCKCQTPNQYLPKIYSL